MTLLYQESANDGSPKKASKWDGHRKGRLKPLIMYQCILNVLNVSLWNDWSKLTYSQVHGSPVLKALYYNVSSKFLRQDLQSSYSFSKIQNIGETELSEEKN